MTATHPTTTAMTTCPHCAALRRRLDRLEADLALARWALRRLAERVNDHGLAALLAGADDADDGEEPV